jgi:hypothetical protein
MRRTWIKLWVDQSLHGSMIAELTPTQRWIFIGLLLLAGDSESSGTVFRRKNEDGQLVGYSDAVLADTLGVEIDEISPALRRMVEKEKVTIDPLGVVSICNWTKYQSEYERKKSGRINVRRRVGQKSALDGEGDVDRDRDKEKKDGRIKNKFDPLFDEFWKGYPKKVSKEVAREKFMILARTGKIPELIKATNGYMDFLKHQEIHKNFKQEPLNPATFLMKERWRDYIEFKYEPPI